MSEFAYVYKPTQDWDNPFTLYVDDVICAVVKVNWYYQSLSNVYLISITSEYSDPYDKVLASEEEAKEFFIDILLRDYINKSIIEELGFEVWVHPG